MTDFGLPNIAPFGESALVLAVPAEPSLALQLRLASAAEVLRRERGVLDAVVGVGNLTLFHEAGTDRERARASLLAAWSDARTNVAGASRRVVEIPVRYGADDGPDLVRVARAHALSAEDVIELHLRGEYVVYVMGFAPGIAYLDGLNGALHTPRLDRPRTRVPAGSVAIGGAMTGVYPSASPGGWNLIGRTECALFDPTRERTSLLDIGTRVRFVRA